MLPALLCVFGWAFLLFDRWLQSPNKAAVACCVFFLGGGMLGFMYFGDGAKAVPSWFLRVVTQW